MSGGFGEDYVALVEHLRRFDDTLSKVDALTLAHALMDIREECASCMEHVFPAVLAAESSEQLSDAISDVRESLRHVAYHISDARQFRVVLPVEPDAPE